MTKLTQSNAARIIAAAAHEYMGDYARGDYSDVIGAAHQTMYATDVTADAIAREWTAGAIDLIAQLVELRHWHEGADWPAEYAAAIMLETFGPPTTPDELEASHREGMRELDDVADGLA